MREIFFAIVFAIVFAIGASQTIAAAPLDDAVAQYRPRLAANIDEALAGARTLLDRVAVNDLAGARKAWIAARGGWERAEVFTADFVPGLDEKIDAWPNAQTGFHAIEIKLFSAQAIDVGANVRAETQALIANLAEVAVKVREMPLSAQGLLTGLTRLIYEIGGDKADGGESRFSGTSLDDMHYNIEGIETAYESLFAAALEASDAKRAAAVRDDIKRLRSLLDVPDLKRLDARKLRATSEELIITLQEAAPAIGLRPPSLEERPQ